MCSAGIIPEGGHLYPNTGIKATFIYGTAVNSIRRQGQERDLQKAQGAAAGTFFAASATAEMLFAGIMR